MTKSVLLDTHIILWLAATPERLTQVERTLIEMSPRCFVSAVSLWEMAILVGLRRLPDEPKLFELPAAFELLPVKPAHCRELTKLPPIHKDPFDRMLIAQARTENCFLLSRDAQIKRYGRQGAAMPTVTR